MLPLCGANCAYKLATSATATDMDVMAFECVRHYVNFLQIMDAEGALLSDAQADEMHDSIVQHLRIYAYLNKVGRQLRGKVPGRNLWVLLPKHHYFMHLAKNVKIEAVNPAFHTLLTAEDFMGRIGAIARSCHRLTVSKRCLERYLASLLLRLDAISAPGKGREGLEEENCASDSQEQGSK